MLLVNKVIKQHNPLMIMGHLIMIYIYIYISYYFTYILVRVEIIFF
jgi:hypothetical protein